MRDGVVPGRAWAVVTEVIAIHVAIGGKPDGVVIDTLTGAIERQRARLATRRDSFGIGALGNMGGGRRNIDQGPVIEINRSEEHTSELQSLMRISYAVFCLKKKKQ